MAFDNSERQKAAQHDWYVRNRENVIARNGARKREKAAERRAVKQADTERLRTAGIKVCVCCKGKKSVRAYTKATARPDGLQPYCKRCQRAKAAVSRVRHGHKSVKALGRRRLEARSFIATAKAGPCTDCEKTWPAAVMHFHHLDPATKSASLARLVSAGAYVEVLEAEIVKCVLLCSNCHIMRHHGEV